MILTINSNGLQPRRRGAMYVVMLLSMIAYLVLGMFVLDIARATGRKIEMGNAADSSAYSAGLMMARGMNAVTVSNHHMGEAMSFIILHSAIAGPNVSATDKNSRQRSEDSMLSFNLALNGAGAKAVGGRAVTYPDCARRINAGGTVCDGKLLLKMELNALYEAQIFFAACWQFEIVEALSDFEEDFIKPEWDALDRMEKSARQSLSARRAIERDLIGSIMKYQDDVMRDIPLLSSKAAIKIGELHRTKGASFPGKPELPVEPEKYHASKSNHENRMAKTQIVRASYPWVLFDREPIISQCQLKLKLSNSAEFYREWSDYYTTERSLHVYQSLNKQLKVIRDNRLPDKGTELWTHDSKNTDKHFSVIGFAYEKNQMPIGLPVLKPQNTAGLVTTAQAITYNANPQKPAQTSGRFQPEIGWDTLNWKTPVRSSMAFEYPQSIPFSASCPRIEINWQTKLVPVTAYLDKSVGDTPSEVSSVIRRVTPVPKALRTH